ncbi:MAG: DUF1565 domain-containing protein [Kineosporiaceae bacterium]
MTGGGARLVDGPAVEVETLDLDVTVGPRAAARAAARADGARPVPGTRAAARLLAADDTRPLTRVRSRAEARTDERTRPRAHDRTGPRSDTGSGAGSDPRSGPRTAPRTDTRPGARARARQAARTGTRRISKGPVLVAFAVALLLVGVALRVLDPPESYTLGVGLPDPVPSAPTGARSSGPSAGTGTATGPGGATATGTSTGTAATATGRAGTATGKAGTATGKAGAPATAASGKPATSSRKPAAGAGAVPAVAGADYYVSPGGSDSAKGSSSAPWRTLEHAMEALRPGDTLVVGTGTYREKLDGVKITPGTSGGPITVKAAPGARPVLAGLLWMHDADYWHISGLNVTWDSGSSGDHMVKFSGGSNWSYTDAEVWGAHAFAAILLSEGTRAFRLARLYVHDTAETNGQNQDHLIYANTDAGGGVIEHCVLADSPNGRAVKIGPPSGSSELRGNLTIRYNTMYNNGGPSNVQVSQKTSNVKVYRNIMVKPASGMQNVTALDLSGSGNLVYDNVVFASAGAVEPGFSGLRSGGGNITADPRFRDAAGGDFRTGNAKVAAYGRYAG